MNLVYNTEAQVQEKHYKILVKEFPGIIAHREQDQKFYIMLWLMKYRHQVLNILSS